MPQTRPTAQAVPAAKPKPPVPPAEFQEGAIGKMDAAGLIRVLSDSSASQFQKAKAGQRLGELAPKEAVPALAAMLGDERLSTYARHGLEAIRDPSAADALRAALPKLKGNLLIGVINSINKRRDAKAVPEFVKMLHGKDADVARAAAAALGSIGGATAMKDLQSAIGKTSGMVRMAVLDASLVCAERLLADGQRDQAMSLYASLTTAEVPKPVRLAAMQGIIREETSISRPR